jgi:hypothetical protein
VIISDEFQQESKKGWSILQGFLFSILKIILQNAFFYVSKLKTRFWPQPFAIVCYFYTALNSFKKSLVSCAWNEMLRCNMCLVGGRLREQDVSKRQLHEIFGPLVCQMVLIFTLKKQRSKIS